MCNITQKKSMSMISQDMDENENHIFIYVMNLRLKGNYS
jgi:hypothetical protein